MTTTTTLSNMEFGLTQPTTAGTSATSPTDASTETATPASTPASPVLIEPTNTPQTQGIVILSHRYVD